MSTIVSSHSESSNQSERRLRIPRGALLAFPASLFVLAVTVLPALQLVRYSFNRYDPASVMQEVFTFENYARFFTDTFYHNVLMQTLGIAMSCTLVSFVAGFPVAYLLAKSQSRFKGVLIVLLVFPLMVGNVVRAAGWMVILGNAGFVNSILIWSGLESSPVKLLYTPLAVVLGTTGVVLPYMILTLQSVLEGLDLSVEEAARNLGAGFFKTIFRVVLPIAVPGIAAGTMLVFILCMNAYATPVLLGGTGVTMMAPAVYDQISKAANWPFGAALAVLLVSATLIAALVSNTVIYRGYRNRSK